MDTPDDASGKRAAGSKKAPEAHDAQGLTEGRRQRAEAADCPMTREAEWPAALAGRNPAAVRARERVAALAPLMAPVLLLGERGSGRRSVARWLHRNGPLRDDPFLTLRCDQCTPAGLPGIGVVHLERVERLSPAQQAPWRDALKRLCQPGEEVHFRILSSSELRLASLRTAGAPFDSELARQLGRFEIRLPSLRDRPDDLPELVRLLLHRASRRLGRFDVSIENDALDALASHNWPGNLLELEEVMEELVAYSAEGRLTRRNVDALMAERAAPLTAIADDRERAERAELLALYRAHGSFAAVARALGISRNAARYRFAKHGLLATTRGRRN